MFSFNLSLASDAGAWRQRTMSAAVIAIAAATPAAAEAKPGIHEEDAAAPTMGIMASYSLSFFPFSFLSTFESFPPAVSSVVSSVAFVALPMPNHPSMQVTSGGVISQPPNSNPCTPLGMKMRQMQKAACLTATILLGQLECLDF